MIIFTELSGDGLDGLELTRLIRRSDFPCRQAPIVMVTAEATAQAIFAARDAGVHEFLRKPYTIRDLLRRLEAVTLLQRDWIEGIAYIGPDRRRFNSGDYAGPRKRRADAEASPYEARVMQAMKIVQAAAGALEDDQMQAIRALKAQADDLQSLALSAGDLPLASAAAALRACAGSAGQAGPSRPMVESHLRTLWDLLPSQMEAEAQASHLAA
jgi:response regulator RpfG family c-di-GMP phosphodiesterase